MPTIQILDQIESWLDVIERANYYELLGVLEIADQEAIRRAFHEFSDHFHPDRYRGQPAELVAAITKIYQRGAEAYGVLRDPKTRARYDLVMSQGGLRYNPGQTSHQAPADAGALVSLARTKGGQLHARQAERALSEGQLDDAKELVRRALRADGENDALAARARELFRLAQSGHFTPG